MPNSKMFKECHNEYRLVMWKNRKSPRVISEFSMSVGLLFVFILCFYVCLKIINGKMQKLKNTLKDLFRQDTGSKPQKKLLADFTKLNT